MKKIALVYQAGIANVFRVSSFDLMPNNRDTVLLKQGDFRSCAEFAKGASVAGAQVRTFACNMAGDISCQEWSSDLEAQPFSDKFIVVNEKNSNELTEERLVKAGEKIIAELGLKKVRGSKTLYTLGGIWGTRDKAGVARSILSIAAEI